jgi:hypothetical protein
MPCCRSWTDLHLISDSLSVWRIAELCEHFGTAENSELKEVEEGKWIRKRTTPPLESMIDSRTFQNFFCDLCFLRAFAVTQMSIREQS